MLLFLLLYCSFSFCLLAKSNFGKFIQKIMLQTKFITEVMWPTNSMSSNRAIQWNGGRCWSQLAAPLGQRTALAKCSKSSSTERYPLRRISAMPYDCETTAVKPITGTLVSPRFVKDYSVIIFNIC